MKYQRFAALVLAAALLLAGCGGTQSSPSAAADQNSNNSRSTPGAVAQAAQTDRITDQYTLEKNVSGVWGEEAVQYISVHVPQLECDSPDAVSLNKDLNAIYAADFREYETYEEAGQPGGEYPQIGVGWDAYWYGNCVSLVVRSRYGGTAPWRYSGWCFDFATGRQITTASSFRGVEKSYAIQAGREVRIIVKPEVVSEDEMTLLARDIAKRIEDELEYPGQIKVHLLREVKVVEYAK